MNWGLIFSNGLYAAVSANAIGYMLIASGLNVHFGNTGLLNFGQAGFAAVGAYGIAIPVSRYHWNPFLAMIVIVVGAVILAVAVGLLTLRLRSDYLAIVTIAIAEIIRIFVNGDHFKWLTGGNDGLQGFTKWIERSSPFSAGGYKVWQQQISGLQLWLFILGWALLAVIATALYLLIKSPWGRVLKGIREDEDAVRSLGKNVFSFKMQSLVLGGVVGAIGGMWFVLDKQSAQPGDFATTLTFFAYTMIIIGGVAKVKGPIVGAMMFLFLFTWVDSFLREATKTSAGKGPVLPKWLVTDNNYAQVKYMFAGLMLAFLVAFRPQGAFGDKKEQAFDVR